MGRRVLVLNSDFQALTVCSVYKAFVLVYLQKAEVVDSVEHQFLRSVSQFYQMPSIIRLTHYVRMPYKSVMLSRQNIFKRDKHKCLYCGIDDNLTLDHVLPRSRGGKTSWTNLVTACKRCNSKKGDFTPEEARMPLPYKPYKPSYMVFLHEFSGGGDASWLPYLQYD